jgi:hypothetical protein
MKRSAGHATTANGRSARTTRTSARAVILRKESESELRPSLRRDALRGVRRLHGRLQGAEQSAAPHRAENHRLHLDHRRAARGAEREKALHALRASHMRLGLPRRRSRENRQRPRDLRFGQVHGLPVLHHGVPVRRAEVPVGPRHPDRRQVHHVRRPGEQRARDGLRHRLPDGRHDLRRAGEPDPRSARAHPVRNGEVHRSRLRHRGGGRHLRPAFLLGVHWITKRREEVHEAGHARQGRALSAPAAPSAAVDGRIAPPPRRIAKEGEDA